MAVSPLGAAAGVAAFAVARGVGAMLSAPFAQALRMNDREPLQAADAGKARGLASSAAAIRAESLPGIAPQGSAPVLPAQIAGDAELAAALFESRLVEFRDLVGERLAQQGIFQPQPIELARDAFGDVTLLGKHPDADAIADIFAEDPALGQLLAELEALYRAAGGNAVNSSRRPAPLAGNFAAPLDDAFDDQAQFSVVLVGGTAHPLLT